ncbi:hypothetical protein MKW98_019666 [Papaver atlanticum]|uniref:Uncharacterized protein n=1 Tax=Papaver atlanticum TaxID=357466 RepID=A0AAD4XBA0_9MAGN|nr:hypothetical protein MKW98_019666 [Papaver atlanticum]
MFGPTIELLDCEDKFFTAGNSLFHVVVETDEISTRIISPAFQQKIKELIQVLDESIERTFKGGIIL